ncbi:MAG TPA: hypothetical protein EYG03_23245 [Planctomycetes bacterium]|nr:hypothetical protein [Fuerstiella sp.]HIK94872.1 hypothetical protein [Planctomycetota bacterium]
MGKFKPFLFGALFGAGTVFIGLQYHIVQSHEGIRVVPRTPQHAIGLAYVDIRNWGAEQWADRPELARALVAHGSTDLVASSVTEGLVESISSESAILDQLRGFVNESPDSNDAGLLFNDSDFAPNDAPSDSNHQGLITIPFEDARKQRSADTASTVNSANRPSLASRDINSSADQPGWRRNYESSDKAVIARAPATGQRDIPSVDDVFGSGRNTFSSQPSFGTASPESKLDSGSAGLSVHQESSLLEDMLFGEEETSSRTSRLAEDDAGAGSFEDITNTLDNRAAQALRRARAGFQQPTNRALPRSADSTNRYVRDTANDSHMDRRSSMFSGDAPTTESFGERRTQLPDPLKAIRDGFDPFVE